MEETPETIEVPLVVYVGDERRVIGTSVINTVTGQVTSEVTTEVVNQQVISRIMGSLGEFSFSIRPTNPTLFPFKDVHFKADIWRGVDVFARPEPEVWVRSDDPDIRYYRRAFAVPLWDEPKQAEPKFLAPYKDDQH